MNERFVNLTPRMSAIADYIRGFFSGTAVVADVGADHGRLSVALIQRGAATRVIASDLSVASVKKIEQLRNKCGMEDKIEALTSDGMSHLASQNFDAVIIAGMGGILIRDILTRDETSARRAKLIVAQPMRGESELRQYLYSRNYHIVDEFFIKEGKRVYQLICACPADNPDELPRDFPGNYYEVGFLSVKKRDPLCLEYLQRQEARMAQFLNTAGVYTRREADMRELLNTRAVIELFKEN